MTSQGSIWLFETRSTEAQVKGRDRLEREETKINKSAVRSFVFKESIEGCRVPCLGQVDGSKGIVILQPLCVRANAEPSCLSLPALSPDRRPSVVVVVAASGVNVVVVIVVVCGAEST